MDSSKGKGKLTLPPFDKNYPNFENESGSSKSKSDYRIFSPYIQKPQPLHICFLDQPVELLHAEDPAKLAFYYVTLIFTFSSCI